MSYSQIDAPRAGYIIYENTRAHYASYADWYEKNKLMLALQKVKRTNIGGTKKDRDAAYNTIFTETPHIAPYDKWNRFPADKNYICDLFDDWKTKLLQLRLLCCEVKTDAEAQITDHRFWKLIQELIDDLFCGVNVVDRTEFETWGFVKWSDDLGDN